MAKAKTNDDLADYPLDDSKEKADARQKLADDDPAKYDPAVNPLNPKLRRSFKTKPFRVEATKIGYAGDIIRRPGDVFTVNSEREFSPNWMRRVAPGTPLKVTGSAAALQQEHDAALANRLAGGTAPPVTGDEDPLGNS